MHEKTTEQIAQMMDKYIENYKSMFGKEPNKKELQSRLEDAFEKKKDELFQSMFSDQSAKTLEACIEIARAQPSKHKAN